jgi:DNA-binding NarL/FixJ family response regulator/class 3 adenylate cyclase
MIPVVAPAPGQGTLTIAFTDVERSTDLMERVGESGWLEVMAAHSSDVRRLVQEHGGHVVKSLGDGFMLTFTSARSAVRCGIQIADSATRFRVRVGIDVGEVRLPSDDVEGRAVVKAQRITSQARGGEVYVSSLVRELCGDDEPDIRFGQPRSIELRGLAGTHIIHEVEPVQRTQSAYLRVAIADDAAIIRDGLAALLEAAGMGVVAACDDADGLMQAVSRWQPDVVITDVRMPPTHTDEGLIAAERIRAEHPGVGVLVLAQNADVALALRLLRSAPNGGVGYLLKDRVSDLDALTESLRRVHGGETVIDPLLTERMMGHNEHGGSIDELTARELDVLKLIAEGRSNRAIADALFVSPKTLEGHISQIFLKLNLRDGGDEHRRVAAVLAYLGHRH